MDAAEALLFRREEFLARVTDRLGCYPSDFPQEMCRIAAASQQAAPQRAAGVLLPLLFRPASGTGGTAPGEFVCRLIKRSSFVTQPGDLSFPGGMVHPRVDRLLSLLVVHGPVPAFRGRGRVQALERGSASFRIIALFLATALRETWEEIGLAPWRVRFLGPLPTYSLTHFRRTIFPLAGFVEHPGSPRLNREVERIVEIPLASFYQEQRIGCLTLSAPDPGSCGGSLPLRYPCLIHRTPEGNEEILWGATFHILTRFLAIVMDYRLPDWITGPVVQRQLRPDYHTERSRR
ncbi:MAG: NUDIX hydrolase [Syntrophales bacterium]